MHIEKRLEQLLSGSIDFDTFYLLSAEPVTDNTAVIFLAPKDVSKDKYFNLRYGKENSLWFTSLENMLEFAVDKEYISKLKTSSLVMRYQNLTRGESK